MESMCTIVDDGRTRDGKRIQTAGFSLLKRPFKREVHCTMNQL